MLDILRTVAHNINTSKFFAGFVMIMLNIGSKYITIKLSKSQEAYLRNTIARQLLIFSIIWMGTRDVLISIAMTAAFVVLTDHLFNEQSKFCIIPRKYRRYEHLLDLDKNNEVTEEELNKAKEVLEKARKKEEKQDQLRNLNNFITQV